MISKIRHWWRNIKWLQRLKDWRYAKVPFALGYWSLWARGEIILERIYWRGYWTPRVKVMSRYPQRYFPVMPASQPTSSKVFGEQHEQEK